MEQVRELADPVGVGTATPTDVDGVSDLEDIAAVERPGRLDVRDRRPGRFQGLAQRLRAEVMKVRSDEPRPLVFAKTRVQSGQVDGRKHEQSLGIHQAPHRAQGVVAGL